MTIRVLVADDQPIVRSGLATLISSEPDLTIIGAVANGRDAVNLATELRPDVVLMDIRMPITDGLEATRQILQPERALETRVVILTTYDLDEYVFEALRSGACGFLLKHAAPEEILLSIRSAAAGNALLSPVITMRLIGAFITRRPPSPKPPELSRLTPRELEVLRVVATGASNSEIAQRLFVAETTVKTHLARALTKLDLRDRVQAVVWAYETGLIRPGD